jgi:hypothetical protein
MTKHIVTATLSHRDWCFDLISEQLAFDDFDEALRKAESLCQDILKSMIYRPYCDYSIEVHVAKDVFVVPRCHDLPLAAFDVNSPAAGYSYSFDYFDFDDNITHWVWYDYDEMGHDLPDMTWNLKPTQYPQGGYNYAD